jgi:hypothetical protein
MKISKRMAMTLVVIGTLIVVVPLLVYLAVPYPGNGRDPTSVTQTVGPFNLQNMEVKQVLQAIADAAPKTFRVKVCKDLAAKKITIHTTQPQTIRRILGDIAVQLQVGIDNEAEPHFRCRRLFDDAIVIENRQVGGANGR